MSSIILALVFFLVLESLVALPVKIRCGETGDVSKIRMRDKIRFQTPYYLKRKYRNNYDCNWTVKLGDTCTVMRINCDYRFRIEDFGADCNADYLSVADGRTFTKYCGRNRPAFNTSVGSLDFVFHSDESVRDRGLRCFARCVSKDPQPTTMLPTPPPPFPPGSCVCGKVDRGTRIVGGVTTEVNEYPWQVALVNPGENEPFCGGTLVNEWWVLTAAHCTEDESVRSFQVILGEHNWNINSETTVFRHDVVRIEDHPNYNTTTFDNDFSLLELSERVDYLDSAYDHVRPACWPTQDIPVGASGIATGWGHTTEGGSKPFELMEVTLPVITNAICQSKFNPTTDPVTANMVCAGNLTVGGIDTCQGDSGGPFVWQNSNSFEIQGVTSWGIGCARPDSPGVYARVNVVLPWMTSITGGDSSCPRNDTIPVTF